MGKGFPPRIMGIVNASPESFLKSSVRDTRDAVREAAASMEEEGADYIDVGGASTAPYLDVDVSAKVELERMTRAMRALTGATNLPISVDTQNSIVASRAMDMGATILNDVTGLAGDPGMGGVISKYDPSMVLCAHGTGARRGDPQETARMLERAVNAARGMGGDPDRMVVDPAIGFFREWGTGDAHTPTPRDWAARDLEVLARLGEVAGGMPVLVSVSNKSFIGRLLGGREPGGRLHGSLAAEAAAVMGGADIIRTHNVGESRDAALVAAAIRDGALPQNH